MSRKYVSIFCLALCLMILSLSVSAAEAATIEGSRSQDSFRLHPNARVVFYGDSITELHFYTWWTDLYVATRFPNLHARFWNAGVGGDRVSGGAGGPIDKRLSRDVFPYKPTVVTLMLGMNDGRYAPLTPQVEKDYSTGYEHILQSLREHLPGVNILCIGPSPYDEVTREKPMFPGGYNSVLLRFGKIDRRLAKKYGASFADANYPFNAALERAAVKDRFAAQLLLPDRVHPDLAVQMLIAMVILHSWNAPALVSSTVLNVKSLSSAGSSAVNITGLHPTKDGLRWSSLESALPLPVSPDNSAMNYLMQYSGVENKLNQEILQVRGLRGGRYRLTVDRRDVGEFSSGQLSDGINLALLNTPMFQQAQVLGWLIRDKDALQFVRTRILIYGSSPEAYPALNRAENQMQQAIWKKAQPVQHQFSLSLISAPKTGHRSQTGVRN